MASREQSDIANNGGKGDANEKTVDLDLDDDELLLLSSPLSSKDDSAKATKQVAPTRTNTKASSKTEEVNSDDDLDLEILEEVTSIPGTFSASGSSSESSEEDLEDENDESASLVHGKINITYSHGSFFIWDAEGKY